MSPEAQPSDLIALLTQIAERDKALAVALDGLKEQVRNACAKVESFEGQIAVHTAAVKAKTEVQAEFRAERTEEVQAEAARESERAKAAAASRQWWGEMAQRFAGSAAGTTAIFTIAGIIWYLFTGSTSLPRANPPSPAPASVTLPAGATP
jgi:hypothetical protein